MPFNSSDSINNANNPISVTMSGAGILAQGSITAVTDNTQTTCVTYTASGSDSEISKIIVSGDANATWTVEVDSVERFQWKAADGNKTRTEDFLPTYKLASGSTIDIKVEHFFTGETANFKSSIVGI